MIEHLLVSSIVLGIAMAAARFLPLTARTRYAVLLAGIAKFAVPTAVFRFVPVDVIPAALRTFGGGSPATIGAQPVPRVEWMPRPRPGRRDRGEHGPRAQQVIRSAS